VVSCDSLDWRERAEPGDERVERQRVQRPFELVAKEGPEGLTGAHAIEQVLR
jgi:hypothetical protein